MRLENGGRGRIPSEERRTCELYKVVLKESTHLKGGYGMDIIVYPNIPGSHEVSHTSCIAACILYLAKAHSDGIIHSDLHLGNFIFNVERPAFSCIIDWDHARSVLKPGKYVPGWQMLLERHPSALPRSTVQMEHDRYSLLQVLKRFAPKEECEQGIWQTLCHDNENLLCSLEKLAYDVETLNMELVLVSPVITTTGSPPRDPLTLVTKTLHKMHISRT